MTRKHQYLLSAAFLVACVCLALGLLAMRPRPGVTKANFQRLEKGMTFGRVEAIMRARDNHVGLGARHAEWEGPNGANIMTHFDEDDRLVSKEWTPPDTVIEAIKSWLFSALIHHF